MSFQKYLLFLRCVLLSRQLFQIRQPTPNKPNLREFLRLFRGRRYLC